MGRAATEARLLLTVVRSFLGAPWVFVYAILGSLGIVGVLAGGAAAGWYLAVLTGELYAGLVGFVVTAVVVAPLFLGVLSTAYCYELNEVISGRRPIPLSGLVVAVLRLHRIAVVVAVMSGSMILLPRAQARASSLGVAGRIVGQVVGDATYVGLKIANVFAFPVLATTDGSLRDGFDRFREAMEAEWGAVVVTATGFGAITRVLSVGFWIPILVLTPINVLAWADLGIEQLSVVTEYALLVDPLGPFTVPLALLAGLFAVGGFVSIGLAYPVKVILFRYAIDGELPAGITVGVDDLADVDDPEEAASGPTDQFEHGRFTP